MDTPQRKQELIENHLDNRLIGARLDRDSYEFQARINNLFETHLLDIARARLGLTEAQLIIVRAVKGTRNALAAYLLDRLPDDSPPRTAQEVVVRALIGPLPPSSPTLLINAWARLTDAAEDYVPLCTPTSPITAHTVHAATVLSACATDFLYAAQEWLLAQAVDRLPDNDYTV